MKLGNGDIKGIVESIVNENLSLHFEENPQDAKKIIEKCIQSAQARLAAKKARDLTRTKKRSGKRYASRASLPIARSGIPRSVNYTLSRAIPRAARQNRDGTGISRRFFLSKEKFSMWRNHALIKFFPMRRSRQ